MAYVMTFDNLQQDMRRYLERGFTAADDPFVYDQLPRLINLAERRIARDLKIQGFIVPVTTTLTAGVATYEKPDRWRDTVSITIDLATGKKHLFAREYGYCRSYWPDVAQTAEPEFYADYDYGHWLITPTPNANVTAEILYYEMPPLLDAGNQTNWLTAFAPNLLLYGALLEATPFLKNDARLGTWQGFYDRALQAVTNEDMKRIMDRSSSRTEA